MRDISVSECKKIWGVGGNFGFRNWILNLLIRLNTIVPDSKLPVILPPVLNVSLQLTTTPTRFRLDVRACTVILRWFATQNFQWGASRLSGIFFLRLLMVSTFLTYGVFYKLHTIVETQIPLQDIDLISWHPSNAIIPSVLQPPKFQPS